MRTLAAIATDALDFSAYGRVFDLDADGPDVVAEPIADALDRYTAEPVVSGQVHVGLTTGPGLPFDVVRMERHPHTREGLISLGDPIALLLSNDPGDRPTAESIRAVLVRAGQCVSLDPNVWHSVCLGTRGPSRYCWLAGVSTSPESPWAEILDGPVRVTLPDAPR